MKMIDENLLLPPRHAAFQKILRVYGLKLHSFSIPPKGTKNTTAVVETDKGSFVLRVYAKSGRSDKRIARELDFLSYLRQHGIPTPRMFPDQRGDLISKYKQGNIIWRCILMEFLPGTHPKRYTKNRLRLLAETHAHIHLLGAAYAKAYPHVGPHLAVLRDDFFSPRLDIGTVKNTAVKKFLERGRQFSVSLHRNLPEGYTQLDYARGNILLQRKKLTGILDFDDLTYAPLVICLGYTVWNALYSSDDIKKSHAYLAHYSRIRPPTASELLLLRDIMLLRNYAIGAMEVLLRGENQPLVRRMIKWEQLLLRHSVPSW